MTHDKTHGPTQRAVRASRVWLRLGLLASALATAFSCNSSDNPEGSSSSHWVRCESNSDCANYEDATCSGDDYCIDDAGDRIEVGGSDVGTTNNDVDTSDDDSTAGPPELVDCNPLARWQRAIEPSDPIVVAQDRAGLVYAVTEFDSDHLVWRSRGDALEPLRVVGGASGSGSGGGDLSLTVQGDDDVFTLLVSSEEDPPQVVLFAGEQEDREPDPAEGEALELLDAAALSDFEIAPIDVSVRVEVHAGDRDLDEQSDPELLLLSPDWAYSYDDFRLFYGVDGELSEGTIRSVAREQSADGSTLVEFDTPGGQSATLTYLSNGDAIVVMEPSGEELYWWKRSSTERGLARLSFQCLELMERRFEPTGTVPELPAEQCDAERVRMGGCLSAPPDLFVGGSPSSSSLDLTGTVADVGTGLPPANAVLSNGDSQGCPFENDDTLRFGDIYQSDADVDLVDELHWLHVESAAGDTWLVLRIPDLDLPLEEGDSVHLLHDGQIDFGGAVDSHVELRDGEGQLLLWLGQSYTLEELAVPAELELETGVESCSLSGSCALDYGYYEIEASLDGESGAALQGESLDLGNYRFVNSAFQIQTGAFVCTDSTAHFIRMAAWHK